ncbi:MAG: FKBP-type peptidyl-prolyl cis-trans isomerase [Armatimonadetes bacterium]|nr:FKBP-type peptidyl-prolyl cis-trans isomerase [Armatimonadota bacterium]
MEASPKDEVSEIVGPPTPPPDPKTPGDFDKKPFKGNGKPVTTATGLKYEDMTVGTGAVAVSGKTAVMHYTGTLTDGTQFDSSRDRGAPFDFVVTTGSVIQGWHEGIAGMKVGGRRKLTIPYQLGYGEAGNPPVIPPKATLIFDVELMDLREAQENSSPF